MKIICISDLHENLIDLPSGDVLAIAGDITLRARYDFGGQARFINEAFNPWVERMVVRGQFKHVVWIAGNHDFVLETDLSAVRANCAHYLMDDGCEIDGVKFWGTPWSAPFCDWGFNASDERREGYFSQIPKGIDLLISHAPPKVGKLGLCMGGHDAGDSVLKRHIERSRPKYCICGHIHEGAGLSAKIGRTKVFNCSVVDFRYDLIEKPWVEIEL